MFNLIHKRCILLSALQRLVGKVQATQQVRFVLEWTRLFHRGGVLQSDLSFQAHPGTSYLEYPSLQLQFE